MSFFTTTVSVTMNYSCKILPPFCFFYCCCCCCCCCLLCLHQISTSTSTSPLSLSENKFVSNLKAHSYFENIEKNNILEIGGDSSRGARRLLLGGPGSSPPRCTLKCGRCMPCKPVHVPVPPGTRMTMEYYPEAWRCKCGNKLYMP